MEISLSDRLSHLDDSFGNRLNKETDDKDICEMVSAILSTLNLEGKDNKDFKVFVVENTKEDFFGIRVFPDAESLDSVTKSLVTQRADYGTFCS